MKPRAYAPGGLRRFVSPEIIPEASIGLKPDHPAVVEGRTLFPTTVVSALDSPRLLVSGKNDPKLGGEITKGPRAGWPIFHVTLEERATCPRSCPIYEGCYGNAMHMARRHNVRSPHFLWLLKAEVATVARQHPAGLLVRLHTLGDFYSVDYVRAWAELLDLFPQLHVFGYTARRIDAPDEVSRDIAGAIAKLTDAAWDQFAIRTSHAEAGPERSVVVDAEPDAPDVIICPAQTHKTEACGSCGLCWAENARGKTIAFLRHGMKRERSAKGPRQPTGRPRGRPRKVPALVVSPPRPLQPTPPRLTPQPRSFVALEPEQIETIQAMSSRGVSAETICSIFEIGEGQLTAVLARPVRLEREGAT